MDLNKHDISKSDEHNKCKRQEYDKNINNGLLPRIWGPHMWKALHCISFGYPISPSDEDKKYYKTLFEILGHVLPCRACGISYCNLIKDGKVKLTDDVFLDRNSLTKWLYDVHHTVNDKLSIHYATTYEQVVEKYESFRVKCDENLPGCIMPIEKKKLSFCNEYQPDYMVLPYNLAVKFTEYALKRGVSDFADIDKYNIICDTEKCHKEYRKEWHDRNNICHDLIVSMRQTGEPSLEINGEYRGLPTINELRLIARLSTNLNTDEILNCIKLLGFSVTKTYKFHD